ncbi:hypothetical protein [Tessaracoccus sp.]
MNTSADVKGVMLSPGRWLIQGWTIWRCRDDGETLWWMEHEDGRYTLAASLSDARENIRRQMPKLSAAK